MNSRNPIVRRNDLLTLLRQKPLHGIDEIKRQINGSSATLHRDLNILQEEGHIRKSYGCIEVLSEKVVLNYQKRTDQNIELKKAIAIKAATLVQPGDSLFLDASSTSYFFATELLRLKPEKLTIVSNSIPLLSLFKQPQSSIKFISTGGALDVEIEAFLGYVASDCIHRLHFTKAFVSGAGFSLQSGLTTSHESLLGILKTAIKSARQTFCLVDSSKYDLKSLFKVESLEKFSAVITNHDLAPEKAGELQKAGINLELA
ncbi:MAG: DeoR/GlpR family DNA-binding transcription regulator [Verrucomicrobiae bacterium]|nr:DeoR/GlpR family DNA-binding transcription regulator [Verrucomicrobiae bacterium]